MYVLCVGTEKANEQFSLGTIELGMAWTGTTVTEQIRRGINSWERFHDSLRSDAIVTRVNSLEVVGVI